MPTEVMSFIEEKLAEADIPYRNGLGVVVDALWSLAIGEYSRKITPKNIK